MYRHVHICIHMYYIQTPPVPGALLPQASALKLYVSVYTDAPVFLMSVYMYICVLTQTQPVPSTHLPLGTVCILYIHICVYTYMCIYIYVTTTTSTCACIVHVGVYAAYAYIVYMNVFIVLMCVYMYTHIINRTQSSAQFANSISTCAHILYMYMSLQPRTHVRVLYI